jgi:hypothetical protein
MKLSLPQAFARIAFEHEPLADRVVFQQMHVAIPQVELFVGGE